jgi:hypothetical protein
MCADLLSLPRRKGRPRDLRALHEDVVWRMEMHSIGRSVTVAEAAGETWTAHNGRASLGRCLICAAVPLAQIEVWYRLHRSDGAGLIFQPRLMSVSGTRADDGE